MNKLFTDKRFRHGGFAILLTIAVIAVAVLGNIAITAADKAWSLSYDITATKIFSITQQTKTILSELNEDIVIYAFYRGGQEDRAVEQMLTNYRQGTERIDVRYIDPYTNPTFAGQFLNASGQPITDGTLVVARPDHSRSRSINSMEMYTYTTDSSTGSMQITDFIGEQKITNAVVYVANEKPIYAYFLTGHQETNMAAFPQAVFDYLLAANIESSSLSPNELDKLQTGDVLVIAAPQSDLTEAETTQLAEFLEGKDGAIYYMTNAGDPLLPNFESIFRYYGFQFNHNLIMEADETRYFQSPVNVVPLVYGHESTQALMTSDLKPVFPGASSISFPLFNESVLATYKLLVTSPTAFARKEMGNTNPNKGEGDQSGEYPLAIAAARSDGNIAPDEQGNANPNGNLNGFRFILSGSSKYITSADTVGHSANVNMFVNGVMWLLGNEDSVTILGKSMTGNFLYFSNSVMIIVWAAIVAVLIPLLILSAGGFVWIKRRHL
jgi:ABC-2 type transport system permease protein